MLGSFGLGTVPLLGTFSFAADRISLATRQRLTRAAGVAMLLLGAWMVWQAWSGAMRGAAMHGMP